MDETKQNKAGKLGLQGNKDDAQPGAGNENSPEMIRSRIQQLINQGDIVVSQHFRNLYCLP